MVKKTGLGKGLSALIPDDFEEKIDQSIKRLEIVNIDLIKPNIMQPRTTFNEEELNSLATSIERNGVIQPIILKKNDVGYEIIAGERRWRASRIAQQTTIPAIIMNDSEEKMYEMSLIENMQRVNLNPIEEGQAYKSLIERYSITQQEVSDIIGKSRTYITNMIRLLQLQDDVIEKVANGDISTGHARALITLDGEAQKMFAQKIIIEGLSVRQLENMIKKFNQQVSEKPEKPAKDPYIEATERRFQDLIGTKVMIHHGKSKGKIEIEYYTEADLERIIGLLE
ncbi:MULTISPECIES: ParB/RepB/Spo0J family partition protein [unclassified Fusibacter]|uniref:ParB/RepB/Spo0J family partition protein n=1 Tax=unclassified Fusibacter TaxID=2624464 RepID=UPI0010127CF8|nr:MULTISPECIES: ParB/RepB/Spo0J family partition protein [unclassified Fusibacter]MCK8060857.1 ParB/RepB/Spo0J family partition protein [Fusibacter sp. A2]NPE23153.1 ParB/RepB/Spo0J family partition protein [Fusibacter sp. A1]RXV59511.1 ParB/RepB/Spo0J family partition protein [Fusibacter sp. A1]